jgi:uncharacterized glyoxalase superfamily protein PhnB
LKPDGWQTVIPRIFTPDVAGLVAFLKDVFGATGKVAPDRPTELRVDDTVIIVSDGGGVREAAGGFFYIYVEDADATYRRAIALGAESIEQPSDMPYGDRRATVHDRWQNIWQIATYREG